MVENNFKKKILKKKIKVLQVVGGNYHNGAFQGANILHKTLLSEDIDSVLLNDTCSDKEQSRILKNNKSIVFIQNNIFKKMLFKIFVFIEKFLKSIFLHTPRETFTVGLFGFDLTKTNEYKNADIIHIHWLSQGFINIRSLSKIKKPVVWTMRDMWAFTGGSHYLMDFQKYEKNLISKFFKKLKHKSYNQNFNFVSVSNWLQLLAQKSSVLKDFKIKHIDNNIDLNDFSLISKKIAKEILNIDTEKQIILFGAQNPQSKRKGWEIFLNSIKKINKEKYFLLIFGSFWSQKSLEDIGIEFKSLGFIKDKTLLSAVYSSADIFVASSIQDAWPKTFAESMCCGTPVVCFENTSISEIVDHKINGYVVKNLDADSLSNGIEWLLERMKNDPIKKEKINSKILNFDSKKIAKKYVKFYEELIKNN